ncbi:MAG: hypothetical protein NT062_00750, partial [Proteobacteria bacterium]|nr:hypothetical protein [Pseudomonadota bacterium]
MRAQLVPPHLALVDGDDALEQLRRGRDRLERRLDDLVAVEHEHAQRGIAKPDLAGHAIHVQPQRDRRPREQAELAVGDRELRCAGCARGRAGHDQAGLLAIRVTRHHVRERGREAHLVERVAPARRRAPRLDEDRRARALDLPHELGVVRRERRHLAHHERVGDVAARGLVAERPVRQDLPELDERRGMLDVLRERVRVAPGGATVAPSRDRREHGEVELRVEDLTDRRAERPERASLVEQPLDQGQARPGGAEPDDRVVEVRGDRLELVALRLAVIEGRPLPLHGGVPRGVLDERGDQDALDGPRREAMERLPGRVAGMDLGMRQLDRDHRLRAPRQLLAVEPWHDIRLGRERREQLAPHRLLHRAVGRALD